MAEKARPLDLTALADLPDRSTFLKMNDRAAGYGQNADIEIGEAPGSFFSSAARESKLKNLIHDQEVLGKVYDKLLTEQAMSKLSQPPPSLGEAEAIVGPGGVGRLPSQVNIPATVATGLARFQPTPQEVATLTARHAEFAPFDPMASVGNATAPLSPLQVAAFPTVVKEQAQAAYAKPRMELKNVNGKWTVINPDVGIARPVISQETGQPLQSGAENPESPIGKLLADRNKYAPESPEYKALDMAVQLATRPVDELVTIDASGKPVVNQALLEAKKAIAEAGAQRTITNVNAYTPAAEEFQKEYAKSARATYDQLKAVPAQLSNIEAAKKLIPKAKGFMGPAGETLMEAAKFLNNRMGMGINVSGIQNAEELRSRIFFNILDNLKKMDAQPSQMQQIIMQQSLGNLGTDPNALANVLDAYADSLKNKVRLYNREVEGAMKKNPKMFPYDPLIQLPPSSLSDEELAAELQRIRGSKRGR